MTIPTLYCGGFEEINIAEQQGSWAAGANLKNGHNCHESSHFVAWKSIPGASYSLQRKLASDFGWTNIYSGSNTIYLDNTPIGGVYEYRTIPFLGDDIEGIPSASLTFIVKPTVTVIANKTCTTITLSWTATGAINYQVLRDDVEVGFTTATSWTGETASGTFTFTVRAFIDADGDCFGEGTVVVAMEAPQAAGTLISSSCVGKNIVEVQANGACGTVNQITQSFQCDGCFNPQPAGIVAGSVRSCSGGNVVQPAWSGTCDNHIVTQLIETCSSLGCLNGACIQPIPPFSCAETNQQATGLGLPASEDWEAEYVLGSDMTVDGICVNAWFTVVGNGTHIIEIYLNGLVVCAAALPSSSTNVSLRPGWASTTPYGSGSPDPNAANYTKWQGNIKVRVFANGTLGGATFGKVRLEAVSWRNV